MSQRRREGWESERKEGEKGGSQRRREGWESERKEGARGGEGNVRVRERREPIGGEGNVRVRERREPEEEGGVGE